MDRNDRALVKIDLLVWLYIMALYSYLDWSVVFYGFFYCIRFKGRINVAWTTDTRLEWHAAISRNIPIPRVMQVNFS